ncbi:tetratricopeptide repeat protein, partial [Methanomethylophilus alvi]|uniref:tetratricopeptide repeat protein n=1 Tax=Methanomethylophilus alvi TaxID=1291540 RepID=UPI0037DD4A7D
MKMGDDIELSNLLDECLKDCNNELYAYIGLLYHEGKGFSKNENKAVKWLKKSFDLGVTWAGYKLFDISYNICDVKSLMPDIISLAKEGLSEYQARLGRAYRDGKGVERDLDKAAEWMRKAADQDLGWAKNELFDVLWKIGTPESYSEMIDVATRFAEAGDGAAMGRLG